MPTNIYTEENTIPFTYRIVHIKTGQWYYGVRFAKNCHPSDLWTTYFTSSKTVKTIIQNEGSNSFTFEIRKVFSCSESAKRWEARVLQKIINWSIVLNKNAWPAVSRETQLKSHITRSLKQENGLTSYQNAALTWKIKENKIDANSGLTYKELKYSKMIETKTKNGTLGKITNSYFKTNNPVFNSEIKKRMIASLKRYYQNNKNHFAEKKHSKKSIMLMQEKKLGENNPGFNTVWITNGVINKRIKSYINIPENFYLGRTKFKKAKIKEYTCPHCGLIGNGSNMKRYHFDNCKKKII